jgi:hypothetical protein
LDNREQDGSQDWYDGGCVSVDEPGQYADAFYSGESFELYNSCNGSSMTMQMVNYGAAFGISDHPDDFYNGDYYAGDNWGGQPHFFNADGAHFYWLGDDFSGFWQLDYNDQTWNDEIQDLYDGGYFYCDEGPMGCQNYDESGEAVYSFTSGDITFTLGGAGCMGIWVDHPTDDWYDGYYYEAEQWDG